MAYMSSQLWELIDSSGLNFSDYTEKFWKQYFDSDSLGIEEMEREQMRLEAQLSAIAIQIKEAKRKKEAMELAGIQEKVDSLIGAWTLRKYLADETHSKFRNWRPLHEIGDSDLGFYFISGRTKYQIQKDMKAEVLKPDSELEQWAAYDFKVKDKKLMETARLALIEELTHPLETVDIENSQT